MDLTGPIRNSRLRQRLDSRCDCQRRIFALAAFFEIAGCFAFWIWLRRGATPAVALLGVASLIAFAFALTRVDSAFAGRAYAAYGGIYIVASLAWLWVVEGQAPTRTDLAGRRWRSPEPWSSSALRAGHAEEPQLGYFHVTPYGR